MAVISKADMEKLAYLLGSSYKAITDGYGSSDETDTAAFDASRAKSFVRGGTEATNGVRASRVSGENIIDLVPFPSAKEVVIRRGKFYINGVEKELTQDVTLGCDILTGATTDGAGGITTLASLDATYVTKGVIYASMEPLTSPGQSDYSTDSASMILDEDTAGGGGNFAIANSFTLSSTTIIDEMQLYLTKTGSPVGDILLSIYPDDDGTPDEPVTLGSPLATSSVSIDSVSSAGGWVDFPFAQQVTLGTSVAYWIVLQPVDSSTEAMALDSSNYIAWNGSAGTGQDRLTNPGDAGTFGAWASVDTNPSCAYRTISYIRANWLADTDFTGVAYANADWLTPQWPDADHTKIAIITALSDGTNIEDIMVSSVATAGTDSILEDARRIVGYVGLEDDDQMSDLFDGVNATEDDILLVANETSTSPAAQHYSDITGALSTHITSNISGQTFKAYFKSNEAYFTRDFRKVWYLNQSSQELSVDFGTRSFGTVVETFNTASGSIWWPTNEYTANMTAGGSLEILTPDGGTDLTEGDTLYLYAIRPAWSTLAEDIGTSAGDSVVISTATDDFSDLSGTNSFVWVEKWGDPTTGELLRVQFATSTNGVLTSSGANGSATDTAGIAHSAGERVYIVDEISITVGSTISTTAQAITPAETGRTYIGVAYINGATVADTTSSVKVRLA